MVIDEKTGRPKSPVPDGSYKIYWDRIMEDIFERDNFKESHLASVKMLCDLYTEYEICKNKIDMLGMTYESEGRNGYQVKKRPELEQMNKLRADIAAYCKLLGIVLTKDTKTKESENKDEWDF